MILLGMVVMPKTAQEVLDPIRLDISIFLGLLLIVVVIYGADVYFAYRDRKEKDEDEEKKTDFKFQVLGFRS